MLNQLHGAVNHHHPTIMICCEVILYGCMHADHQPYRDLSGTSISCLNEQVTDQRHSLQPEKYVSVGGRMMEILPS